MGEPDGALYLGEEIAFHVRHHFRPEALSLWREARVRWGPIDSLPASGSPGLFIPSDLRCSETIGDAWKVPFHGTELTLWNRVPRPDGWTSWPSDDRPLWYRLNGRAIPAWDLVGTLLDLLALGEETRATERDRHGRFTGAMSPRDRRGLLTVPAFNEAVAAMIGLLRALRDSRTDGLDRLDGLLERPAVILSHDLDLLRGNDAITQSIRLYRLVRPLLRGRGPDTRYARALLANQREPYRRYRDAIARVVEIEQSAGARSSFYFLNGSGGRFGARSGSRDIPAARELVPRGWNVGMHYNYDTHLDPKRFDRQRHDLERLLGQPLAGGRAHYLRFDPRRSFAFLEQRGMRYDESLGYRDRIGYRAGIAGAYHARAESGRRLELVEAPLAIMDLTLNQIPEQDREATFLRLFDHLAAIGGSLSYLLHLEEIGHPELDGDDHGYVDLLRRLKQRGARFLLPTDFLDPAATRTTAMTA